MSLTDHPMNLIVDARSSLFSEADGELLDLVQRQTFRFFWEGAHRPSGLARDRQKTTGDPDNHLVAIGGSGFGIMSIIVAVERSWILRDAAAVRLDTMLSCLERTPRYHGMFPHFINGRTGETIPFGRKDDGGDVVESTFLFQGLLSARQYFDRDTADEQASVIALTGSGWKPNGIGTSGTETSISIGTGALNMAGRWAGKLPAGTKDCWPMSSPLVLPITRSTPKFIIRGSHQVLVSETGEATTASNYRWA
jgi:hypothetical protein